MSFPHVVLSCFSADALFWSDESGVSIGVDPRAGALACEAMGLPADSVLVWTVPPVSRFGSSTLIATACCGSACVEFHLSSD
jgi:hypothetical protein